MLETAFAKINLALMVRRRRDDGYHDIETFFAFVDQGDVLGAALSDRVELSITGPFSKGLSVTDNLVIEAARALQQHSGFQGGAALTLDKRLPVASGIGGGSADAAAALRLLNRVWALDLPLPELADIGAPLGADIPACVYSQPMRGTGTGTDLTAEDGSDIKGKPLLLVNPNKPVSTAAVFGVWDGQDDGSIGDGSGLEVARNGQNGLQDAAIAICPEILGILALLDDEACLMARMSGSGATCVGLYPDEAARDAAQARLAGAYPQYWMLAGAIR